MKEPTSGKVRRKKEKEREKRKKKKKKVEGIFKEKATEMALIIGQREHPQTCKTMASNNFCQIKHHFV